MVKLYCDSMFFAGVKLIISISDFGKLNAIWIWLQTSIRLSNKALCILVSNIRKKKFSFENPDIEVPIWKQQQESNEWKWQLREMCLTTWRK